MIVRAKEQTKEVQMCAEPEGQPTEKTVCRTRDTGAEGNGGGSQLKGKDYD